MRELQRAVNAGVIDFAMKADGRDSGAVMVAGLEMASYLILRQAV